MPITRLHTAKQGESIGYGATAICEKDCLIATVAGGYADGLLRALSGNACGYIHGYSVPLVGRVSMDSLIFDLSELPKECRVAEGMQIEILGPHQSIDTLAIQAETISYELLTALGQRYKRHYLD